MIVNKCPLKNIIRNHDLVIEINNNVVNINKIVIQTYQFLNMYLLHKYTNNEDFPVINDIFIKSIIKTMTKRQDTRGNHQTKKREYY